MAAVIKQNKILFISIVHAIYDAYEMPSKVPCANNYGSCSLIRLCHKKGRSFIIALVLHTVVTNHDFDHFLT